MAFRTQKISQMTPKGADLEATDLIEVSTIESGSYVTRSITGQELIDAIPPTTIEWGDIGGTLSNQTDLNTALNGKVPTSRTLTINGVTQDLSADRTFTIATGLTVGTTPIASGTIGRVLFQGTGNVLQQSSSLFWDSTNNRLGIGTATPLYRFDVTGMSRFNTNIATTNSILRLTDNTNGTAWMGYSSVVAVGFFMGANGAVTLGTGIGGDNSAPTGSQISIRPVTGARMGFNTNSANDGFQFSDGANGTIRFNFPSSNETAITTLSTHNFSIGTASGTTGITTTTMKFFQSTGNVGINTTTDAGFRLDVNGTARVATNLTVSTSGNGNMNTYLGGSVAIGNDWVNDGYILKIKSINTGTAGIYLRAGGAGGYPIFWCQDANGTASTTFIVRENGSVHVGATANVPSSKLTLTSTTQGFLPPRMTTTEKNAIASPATGLQVYDTTLNQMSYYNGTTWTNI